MKFNITHNIIWLIILATSACSSLTIKQEKTIVELKKDVQFTIQKVNKKVKANPESVLQNSISALDSILEYTETVKSDPSKFSPEKIKAYILKINIINENMERFSDLTLQTDVSFPLGTYKLKHLSKKGKVRIDQLTDKIYLSIREMAKKYPQKQIKVMVKTIGYTDETQIVTGSRLEKEIIKAIPKKIESNPSKKRQQYSQILSQFRASTLSQYVVQHLQQKLLDSNRLEITTEIQGLGEKLPSKKSTELPYKNKDPRRRVCIISPFVEIIP